MPKHVTYPGPHAEVTVPGVDEPVTQGEAVEVESELADALIAQGWLSAREANTVERRGEQPKPPDAPPVEPPKAD